MRAARLERSSRLQRVYALMSDGKERSTRDISDGAGVYAVNSCISELRANGLIIDCRQQFDEKTRGRVWYYRMRIQGAE